jgi:TRAP-type C4-dicarboxylate transport system substrate-binding protein
VVDGQENPLYIITSSKFYEVQKYLSFTKHVYTSNYLLFSQAKWNKYPADVQKVLQDAANEVADKSWTMDEELDKQAMQIISRHMQVNDVDLVKFKAAAMPIYKDEKFIKPIGQGLMSDVLKTLGVKI